jgi:subtilisin family serine protease
MFFRKAFFAIIIFAVAFGFYSCSKDDGTNPLPGKQIVRGANDQYIIVYKDKSTNATQSVDPGARAISLLESHGIPSSALISTYKIVLNGFSAKLTLAQAELLLNDSRVEYVAPDQEFSLPDTKVVTDEKFEKDNIQAQTTPWGITAVGGTGTTTKVAWILDTGIDLDHPDLNVDVTRSRTFVKYGKDAKSPDDNNGHGTHVSGTIAARNNTVGVVGVAPGASVVAVKVLNLNGSGYISDIIEGLDYIGANASPGDVINISLGGGAYQPLDNAVVNTASLGIFIAIAAGNDYKDANNYSPARANHANIFTVSAYANGGSFASFSNWGNPPIDYSTPGVSIYSTYKGGKYATMSGTSMAAPHMAGILLVKGTGFSTNGTVSGDPDGNPDSRAHL